MRQNAVDTVPPAAEPSAEDTAAEPPPLPRRSPDRVNVRTVSRRDPAATDPKVLRKVLDGLNRLEPEPPGEPAAPTGQAARRRKRRSERKVR